ncbi:hypothetical protein GQ472_07200 [archaeon]|nr:hypothetical protein [archaeon]
MKMFVENLKKFFKKEEMIVPAGLTFKFLVKPMLTKQYQKRFKYGLVHKSGLSEYYKILDVEFFENYKGKQMLIKVFCPEPVVAIEKSKENEFYNQMKNKFSEWVINTLKDNKYDCKHHEFNHTVRLA